MDVWKKFVDWVKLDWTPLTFIIVMTAFSVLGLLTLLSFFKGNFNKGKIKWLKIIFAVILLVCVGVLCYARFA